MDKNIDSKGLIQDLGVNHLFCSIHGKLQPTDYILVTYDGNYIKYCQKCFWKNVIIPNCQVLEEIEIEDEK